MTAAAASWRAPARVQTRLDQRARQWNRRCDAVLQRANRHAHRPRLTADTATDGLSRDDMFPDRAGCRRPGRGPAGADLSVRHDEECDVSSLPHHVSRTSDTPCRGRLSVTTTCPSVTVTRAGAPSSAIVRRVRARRTARASAIAVSPCLPGGVGVGDRVHAALGQRRPARRQPRICSFTSAAAAGRSSS
jgi:hypothetical protein